MILVVAASNVSAAEKLEPRQDIALQALEAYLYCKLISIPVGNDPAQPHNFVFTPNPNQQIHGIA